jgi:hypothetical protein
VMACEREHDWEVWHHDKALKEGRVRTVTLCSPRAAQTRVEAIVGKLVGNALMSATGKHDAPLCSLKPER